VNKGNGRDLRAGKLHTLDYYKKGTKVFKSVNVKEEKKIRDRTSTPNSLKDLKKGPEKDAMEHRGERVKNLGINVLSYQTLKACHARDKC